MLAVILIQRVTSVPRNSVHMPRVPDARICKPYVVAGVSNGHVRCGLHCPLVVTVALSNRGVRGERRIGRAQYIMPTCSGSGRWKYTLGLLLKVGSTVVYTLPSSPRTITPARIRRTISVPF